MVLLKIGTRTPAVDRPRPILFKLHDAELKIKVWLAKTGLKGIGITLSEFLTKSRHIFMAARQRCGVSKCWTTDSSIFIIAPDGERLRVSCQQELDKICPPSDTLKASPAVVIRGPCCPKEQARLRRRRIGRQEVASILVSYPSIITLSESVLLSYYSVVGKIKVKSFHRHHCCLRASIE